MQNKKFIIRWFLIPWIILLIIIVAGYFMVNQKPPYKLTSYPDLSNVSIEELISLDQKRAISEGVSRKENFPRYIKGNDIGILLIHGYSASPYEMNELGDFLSAKGFSVYVARVVGHGSKSEYLGKLSYKDWYDSLKYGYFTLMNTCKRVYLLGQSMGGLLALNIASNNKSDGVILLSPAFDVTDYRFDFIPILQYILNTYGKDNASSSYKDFYYEKVPTRSFTQLKFLIDYTWLHTKDINVPMILFQSRYDNTVTYEGSRKYYELYKGPKKFISIEDPNVKHILSSSFNPKRDYVYDEIYKWLEEQNAKK